MPVRTAIALLLATVLLRAAPAASRSNVILIVLDAWRADRLSARAGQAEITAFLDTLVARAYAFERAYAATSYTPSSVASLLTGRHPARHGVRWFDSVLVRDIATLPEQGYQSGIFTPSPLFANAETTVDAYRFVPDAHIMRGAGGAAEVGAQAIRWLDERARSTEGQRPVFLYLH